MTPKYEEFLRSPKWKRFRQIALRLLGEWNGYGRLTCPRCRLILPPSLVQVHHKTYERVGGRELLADLELLCEGYSAAHAEGGGHVSMDLLRCKPIGVALIASIKRLDKPKMEGPF